MLITGESLIAFVHHFLIPILEGADEVCVSGVGSRLANISFILLFHVWFPLKSKA